MPIATSNPKIPALAMALAGLVPAWGQEINIRGLIQDGSTNTLVSGAKVALIKNGLSSQSNASGYFQIRQIPTDVARRHASGIAATVQVRGNLLICLVPEGVERPVSISVSDLNGRTHPLFHGSARAGVLSVDLAARPWMPGVCLLDVTVDGVRTGNVVRLIHDGNGLRVGQRTVGLATGGVTSAARTSASAWDTLEVSKSGYATKKVALAASTDSVAKIILSPSSSIPAEASLSAGPLGFATQNGGTTGGGTVAATTVTTCAELKTAAADKNPRVIRISGTIVTSECNGGYGLPIASNKTVIGADKKATVKGGLYVNSGVSNVIIRNLNVQGNWPNAGADDAVHVQGATRVWLDHLNIWDATDGNLDITGEADYVTVSWCKFWYTDASHDHRLNGLIGSGGGDHPEDWGKLHVTYHHNWYSTLVNERMPRLMYGTGHVYNNYYTSSGNGYCVGFGSYGTILVENNYFKGVKNPISFMYDVYAWIVQRGNTFDNTTGTGPSLSGKQGSRAVTGQDFAVAEFKTPPYAYSLTKAADVPTLVSTYAGPQ